MTIAHTLVFVEWLLTLGCVTFFGYALGQGILWAHSMIVQSQLWNWLADPSLEQLLMLLG